jgi:hypothetical protein
MSGCVGIVIEPPLSMTNVVLDAARRVFVEDSGEDAGISFFPPESYMVPLAVRSGGDIQDLDIAAMALNLAAKEVVEFGVQLGPLTMDHNGLVSSQLSTHNGDLPAIVATLVKAFEDVGCKGVITPPLYLPIAWVGKDRWHEIEGLLKQQHNTPLAGWLVYDLCVAGGFPGPEDNTWILERYRCLPLRRYGYR